MVDGPDGVAVTLTAGAAEETGHRLISGACEAAGYNRMNPDGEHEPSEEKSERVESGS